MIEFRILAYETGYTSPLGGQNFILLSLLLVLGPRRRRDERKRNCGNFFNVLSHYSIIQSIPGQCSAA